MSDLQMLQNGEFVNHDKTDKLSDLQTALTSCQLAQGPTDKITKIGNL